MSNEDPPRRYFPVDVPHRLPGIQSALGTGDVGDRCIELDAEQPEYRRCKSATTDAVYRTPYDGSREDERRAFEALRRATEAEHSPPHALATAADLDELVAEIQEDVVLMRRDTDAVTPGSARAVYLNVCFPTGWCPACMNGRAFTAIHGPVPALHDFPGGRGRGEWGKHLL